MAGLQLYAVHEAAGAVFMKEAGLDVPVRYGDVKTEYRAVREAAGITDRSARGTLRVTGADRVRFLHGMLTHTVQGLAVWAGNYAAMTTPQGHTLADVWVHNRAEEVLLETEPGLQQKLWDALDKFLIADDVTIEDATPQRAILGVQGLSAAALVSSVLGEIPVDLPEMHTVVRSWNGMEVAIVARSYTGLPGYDLWVSPDSAGALWDALVGGGCCPVGVEALEILRIEAGIPRYGSEVDERVMPLEAGMAHAVDFNKGCFIGQEALAKMQNLGKPRRYLVGIQVESDAAPVPGTDLLDGDRKAGWVTSSLRSETLGRTVALVRRGLETPGQVLSLADGTRTEVVALPFV